MKRYPNCIHTGALCARGDAGLADDFKIVIYDTGGDVGATQVDTNAIHRYNSP